MPEKLFKLMPETARRLLNALEWVENFSLTGSGVTAISRSDKRFSAHIPGSPPSPPSPRKIELFARITGNTQDGSNKRWIYDFEQVAKTSAGYGGWEAIDGGLVDVAYNLAEDQNGATGLWGNGVDSSNIAGTNLDIKPIPTGLIVRLFAIVVTDGTTEYWLDVSNAIDGAC